jgi:hypothetical protein
LQVFYIDVAKLNRDVAHVAMTIHECFKCMFQMFQLFQTYVASVHLDVAKVDLDVAYTYMLQAYISSILGVSDVCCKSSYGYCICFAMITRVFKFFSGVLHVF